MARISAVVLTYNRKALVQSCLEAVFAQTRPCDTIVVIDNCSTDGTAAQLRETWGDRIALYVLPKNIGAAGGFSTGMRVAFAGDADFIWMMDDDVIPEPDALERLLAAEATLAELDLPHAFVTSVARAPNGELTNVPAVDTRLNAMDYENWPCMLEHKMVPVRRATFVSVLFPRQVVLDHGLPLAPMFIWGEDTEYTIRITRDRPGFIVGDSKVVHVRAIGGAPDILTETDKVRLRYHRYHARNATYVARVSGRPRVLARHLAGQARLLAKLCARAQFAKAGIVASGTLQGLWFRPKVERVDAAMTTLRAITNS